MKNYIIFFILVMVMVFSNYEISYSQKIETGNFYFLTGTAEDEEAVLHEVILYLNIIGTNVFGYFNEVGGSYKMKGFVDKTKKIIIDNIHILDNNINIEGSLSDSGVFTGEIYNTWVTETNTYKINLSLSDTPINSAKISAERVRLSGQIGRGDNFKYKNIKYDFNNKKLNDIVNNSNNREDLKICYLDDKIIILYSEADGFNDDITKIMKKDGNTNYRDKNSGYPYYFVYSLENYEEIDISDFIDFSAYNSLISKIASSDSKLSSYSKPYTFSVKPNGDIIIGFDTSPTAFEYSENEDFYELINEGWGFYSSMKLEIKRGKYSYSGNDLIDMEILKLILKKGSPLDYLFN